MTALTRVLVFAMAGFATCTASATESTVDPRNYRDLTIGRAGPHGLKRVPRVPVLVRLTHDVTSADLAELTRHGLQFEADGPSSWRDWLAFDVDRTGLDTLRKLPIVAEVARAPAPLLPVDHTTGQIRLAPAKAANLGIGWLQGEGMLLGDLDASVDLFHPAFFHADAGWFDWLDLDHDGHLTPGIDAIDLDRDGKAGSGEIVSPVQANMLDYAGETIDDAREAGFDPRMDWLYLDTNGNGLRDFGAEGGFDDLAPAFGEPLFVPEDWDGDGQLEPGERLARLGTCKIRALRVQLITGQTRTFERGKDLSEYSPVSEKIADNDDHGTGVLSIALGDVPLAGRRFVGVAPLAEAVVGSYGSKNYASLLLWALGRKPDVMLYESAWWYGDPVDGSDAVAKIIDKSAAAGQIAHVCPVGNQAGSGKHVRLELAAGQERTVVLNVPEWLPAQAMYVSINARGSGAKKVTATLGPGQQPLPFETASTPTAGMHAWQEVSTTAKGTRFLDLVAWGTGQKKDTWAKLTKGKWQLQLAAGGAGATIDVLLADDVSVFGPGVMVVDPEPTDDHTVGLPSVAESCIAVGAFTGHSSPPGSGPQAEEEGTLRGYSARGPRIDGLAKPDVLAPDNPWVARGRHVDEPAENYGTLWTFGGTSGAGPHVAAVALLLLQAGRNAPEVRDILRQGSQLLAGEGPVPDSNLGWGRLDAAASFGVAPAAPADAATLVVQLQEVIVLGEAATLTLAVLPTQAFAARWDDGYDGNWDTAFAAGSERSFVPSAAGRQAWKVQVVLASGQSLVHVVWRDVLAEPPPVVVPAADALSIPVTAATVAKPVPSGCSAGSRTGATASVWFLVLAGLGACRSMLQLWRRTWHSRPG